jgi:hypothetical protein
MSSRSCLKSSSNRLYLLVAVALLGMLLIYWRVCISPHHLMGTSLSNDRESSLLRSVDLSQTKAVASQYAEQSDKRENGILRIISTSPLSIDSQSKSALSSSPSLLHAVTYASHHGRDDRFCRAVESALQYNYTLTILGWGQPWKGLAQKLEAAYHYALQLPDNDLLLFTDAFDVLFTSRPEHVIEIFFARNYSILFAGECGCWPHITDDKEACFDKYPLSPTPYRYLNSGTWVALAKYARRLLKTIIERAGDNFMNANDQKLVADMFISQEYPIALDYYSEIFQSMHSTDPPDLPYCHPSQHIHLKNKSYRNRLTNSFPSIFHFNGGGKAHHLEMERKMWYKAQTAHSPHNLAELKATQIITPTQFCGKMKFQDICDDYLESEYNAPDRSKIRN